MLYPWNLTSITSRRCKAYYEWLLPTAIGINAVFEIRCLYTTVIHSGSAPFRKLLRLQFSILPSGIVRDKRYQDRLTQQSTALGKHPPYPYQGPKGPLW